MGICPTTYILASTFWDQVLLQVLQVLRLVAQTEKVTGLHRQTEQAQSTESIGITRKQKKIHSLNVLAGSGSGIVLGVACEGFEQSEEGILWPIITGDCAHPQCVELFQLYCSQIVRLRLALLLCISQLFIDHWLNYAFIPSSHTLLQMQQ